MTGCYSSKYDQGASAPANAPTTPGRNASELVAKHLDLSRSEESITRMRVRITNVDSQASPSPSVVEMKLYNKTTPDAGRLMLLEFLVPTAERDRDSLVRISPNDEVEGIRYVQSNDSFLTTRGVVSEDALFGMTLQELAGGQPQKYNFKLAAEESLGQWQVYKLEGTLKPGTESKFERLVLYLDRESHAMVGAEFYDNHNELARRMTVQKMELIAGHWTRKEWTLENPVRGKRLEFVALEVQYDPKLADSIFSREHLKKIASK
jgi:hypothetical protein